MIEPHPLSPRFLWLCWESACVDLAVEKITPWHWAHLLSNTSPTPSLRFPIRIWISGLLFVRSVPWGKNMNTFKKSFFFWMITGGIGLFRDPRLTSSPRNEKGRKMWHVHCRKVICYRIKSVGGTQVIPWSLVFKTQDMWLLHSISVENYLIKIQRNQPWRLLFAVVLWAKKAENERWKYSLKIIKIFVFIYCPKCSFSEKVAALPITFAVVLWERHLFIEKGANWLGTPTHFLPGSVWLLIDLLCTNSAPEIWVLLVGPKLIWLLFALSLLFLPLKMFSLKRQPKVNNG